MPFYQEVFTTCFESLLIPAIQGQRHLGCDWLIPAIQGQRHLGCDWLIPAIQGQRHLGCDWPIPAIQGQRHLGCDWPIPAIQGQRHLGCDWLIPAIQGQRHLGCDWLIPAILWARQEKLERTNVLEIFRETHSAVLVAKCCQARKSLFPWWKFPGGASSHKHKLFMATSWAGDLLTFVFFFLENSDESPQV